MSTTTCPKCSYVRKTTDTAPEFECPSCGIIYAKYDPATDMKNRVYRARSTGDWKGIPRDQIPPEFHGQVAATIPLSTTHEIPNAAITEIIEVISSECAYGMNLFKDIFTGVTDLVGGRSASTQNTLRDARRAVMAQLRVEAFYLGADAVVGVNLDYSEFSGAGKSMLFVVATGTAVKLTSSTSASSTA